MPKVIPFWVQIPAISRRTLQGGKTMKCKICEKNVMDKSMRSQLCEEHFIQLCDYGDYWMFNKFPPLSYFT